VSIAKSLQNQRYRKVRISLSRRFGFIRYVKFGFDGC
jgi:hypothetical protein